MPMAQGVSFRAHYTLLQKSISLSRINHEVFADRISDVNCNVDFSDVNQFAHNVAVALYECSKTSQEQVRVKNVINVTWRDSRWDTLLCDRDDANVWKAIDWKGNFQDGTNNNVTPTDEEFKAFYENVSRSGL